MATLFAPLKIRIAELKIRQSRKPTIRAEKFLDILYRSEITAILPYFGLNLVAMATPFPKKTP